MLELAQAEMANKNRGDFEKEYLIQEPFKDLGEVLRKFKRAQTFLKTEKNLERLAFECIEDAYLDGIRVIELRYSPTYVQEVNPDLSFAQIHNAFVKGIIDATRKYPMAIGIILIIQRTLGTDVAAKVTEFALSKPAMLVGLDLADNEECDAKPFLPYFKMAKAAGLKLTLHAGEMPTEKSIMNIKEAVEIFQVDRVGHGIQAINSNEICELLIKKQIPLEICPTSNYLTQGVSAIQAHPVRKLWEKGVLLTLNTDDPGIFNIDLSNEYKVVYENFNFTEKEFKKMNKYAFEKSFIAPEILSHFKHFFAL